MNLFSYIKKNEQTESNLTEAAGNNNIIKDDSYYFHMLNEDTGKRYDIPLLSMVDPDYYYKYVYYMKTKEKSEDTFNKIINWG